MADRVLLALAELVALLSIPGLIWADRYFHADEWPSAVALDFSKSEKRLADAIDAFADQCDEFDAVVDQVLADLSDEQRDALHNLAIMVEAEPSEDDAQIAADMAHHRVLGLFRGLPLTKRSKYLFSTRPNEIVLFEGPIRRYVDEGHDLRAVIQDVILHELGHAFGLTHAEMGATCQV